MATRDSKLKGRASRSRTPGDQDKGKPPAPSAASRASPDKGMKHGGNTNRQATEERLIEIVDEERTHLAQAEAILDCLHIALTHAEEQDVEDNDRPYFPYVADIARELVRQSVHRLDSLYLGPRLRRASAAAAAL
jgi:hypothetical protein